MSESGKAWNGKVLSAKILLIWRLKMLKNISLKYGESPSAVEGCKRKVHTRPQPTNNREVSESVTSIPCHVELFFWDLIRRTFPIKLPLMMSKVRKSHPNQQGPVVTDIYWELLMHLPSILTLIDIYKGTVFDCDLLIVNCFSFRSKYFGYM